MVWYSRRRRNQYGRNTQRSMSLVLPNRPTRLVAMVTTKMISAGDSCKFT